MSPAYLRGFVDAMTKGTDAENPYPENTNARQYWVNGFMDGIVPGEMDGEVNVE